MIYGLRVVAVGGGTGLAALLTGLKKFVDPPDSRSLSRDSVYFADLAALVTVTDDGGSSGRLRDELQILPPGDVRNCLLALSSDESLLSSLFSIVSRATVVLAATTLAIFSWQRSLP